MATTRRRTTPTKAATPARKAAPKKATPTKAARDVTVYADKEPTDYHRAYATWIVKEVGYSPNDAASKKEAFLMGVSIATAARPAFNDSEFLEDWRERTGTAKRGPKPKTEAETQRRKTRQVVADDEFEDEGDEEFEDETDSDDDEFEDDEEFEDDDDSDEDDDSDDDEFEDDVEEEPAPKRRGRPAKAAPAKRTPAKKATGRRASSKDDDDFLF